MLAFDRVHKQYGDRSVVDGVTASFSGGTIAALAGVNGSGKSTLFRIAAGFVRPTSGSVSMAFPGGASESVLDRPPSRRVAMGLRYIAQERRVPHGLSTLEMLRAAGRALPRSPSPGADEILGQLEKLRLTHLLGCRPDRMEPAGKLLLLLAAAWMANPAFLIADEPFPGLGSSERAHCVAILRAMRDRGTGVLVTDHHASALLDVSDTVTILQAGRVVYADSAAAARSSAEARRLYFRNRA